MMNVGLYVFYKLRLGETFDVELYWTTTVPCIFGCSAQK